MASVVAPLTEAMRAALPAVELGAVLPIDRYLSDETAMGKLATGGALFVVTTTDAGRVVLVAILEAPELSYGSTPSMARRSRRPAGAYAPVNETPVTDITTSARGWKGLAKAKPIAAAQVAALRALVGDGDDGETDRPPIAAVATLEPAPKKRIAKDASPIAHALAHLATGAIAEAIAALVDAWRAVRDPALADLIDRASRLLPTYDRPLFSSRFKHAGARDVWSAALANATSTLPQVLQNVGEAALDAKKQWTQLARLPSDPRIADWMIVQSAAFDARFTPPAVIGAMAAALVAAHDVRGRPALRLFVRRAKASRFAFEPQDAIAKLSALAASESPPPAVPASDLAAIATALDPLEVSIRRECELVDDIAEHGDDPEPYAVYADWLQERQHPRGEYMALVQRRAAGQLTAAQARRLAAFDDVPRLFGAIDEMAMSHARPRQRGVDRTLAVAFRRNERAWRMLAMQPLARAIATLELRSDLDAVNVDGLAAFARASPGLVEVRGLDPKLHAAFIAATGKAFGVARGGVLRRPASSISR